MRVLSILREIFTGVDEYDKKADEKADDKTDEESDTTDMADLESEKSAEQNRNQREK